MKNSFKTNIATTIGLIGIFAVLTAFTIPSPWDIPEKYKKMKNPTKATKQSLMIGKMLYNKHCKSCHGSNGEGDGPKARRLETTMRDFGNDEVKNQADGVLYYKSFIGRGEMPNFEKDIPEKEDRWFIINYMRSFE